MRSLFFLSLIPTILVVGTACKSVDLRTPYMEERSGLEERGRALIERSIDVMGYDALARVDTYEADIRFDWKTIWRTMPMNSFPGTNNKAGTFRFATGSFDGQLELREGRHEGETWGIQSFEGYTIDDAELKSVKSARHAWGLATYHYITEAPLNLRGAEIVRYAGPAEFEGKAYETVYVTWGSEEPNRKFDRFLMYFDAKTGFLEMSELTIGDFFLPMPAFMKNATVRWDRQQTDEGVWLPSKTYIQLKRPKSTEKYVYTFVAENYRFDETPLTDLRPLDGVAVLGMSKPDGM